MAFIAAAISRDDTGVPENTVLYPGVTAGGACTAFEEMVAVTVVASGYSLPLDNQGPGLPMQNQDAHSTLGKAWDWTQ